MHIHVALVPAHHKSDGRVKYCRSRLTVEPVSYQWRPGTKAYIVTWVYISSACVQ